MTILSLGKTTNSGDISIIKLCPVISLNAPSLPQDEIISDISFDLPLTLNKVYNSTYNLTAIIFNKFNISNINASWQNSSSSSYWTYNGNSSNTSRNHYWYQSSNGIGSYGFHNGGGNNSSYNSTISKMFPNNEGILASFTFNNIISWTNTGEKTLSSSNASNVQIYKKSTNDWTWNNSAGGLLGIGLYETNGYDYETDGENSRSAIRWLGSSNISLNITSASIPDGIIHYNNNGEWINCIPYYYDNGWKQCIPYYHDGSNWKQLG